MSVGLAKVLIDNKIANNNVAIEKNLFIGLNFSFLKLKRKNSKKIKDKNKKIAEVKIKMMKKT